MAALGVYTEVLLSAVCPLQICMISNISNAVSGISRKQTTPILTPMISVELSDSRPPKIMTQTKLNSILSPLTPCCTRTNNKRMI